MSPIERCVRPKFAAVAPHSHTHTHTLTSTTLHTSSVPVQLAVYPVKLLERTKLTVRNAGPGDAEVFALCSHASAAQGAAEVQVAEIDTNNPEMANEMDPKGSAAGRSVSLPDGVECVDYGLLSPLKEGEMRDLVILTTRTDHVVAHPRERKQLEVPMVLVSVPEVLFSMYEIVEEKTQVKLASEKEATKTSEGGRSFTQEKDTLTLETMKNVEPFTSGTMKLHFELTKPLLRATSLERDIYVSHWGTVRIQELYDVRNDASAIKGEFSRADFLLKDEGTLGGALQFRAGLPSGAFDIRYRDEIGNISTSTVARSKNDEVKMMGLGLEPRFPLFGGWHTKFEVSYSLGLEWLVRRGETGLYEMVFTQVPSILDVVYENIVTKIHLPEGSTLVEPPKLDNQRDLQVGEERTFLSVLPRPVVTVRQTNVVSDPVATPIAEIKYAYQPWLKFDKVLAAVASSVVVGTVYQVLASVDLGGAAPSSKAKKS